MDFTDIKVLINNMERKLNTRKEINLGPLLKITKQKNNKIRIGHIKNGDSDIKSKNELNLLALKINDVEHTSEEHNRRILSNALNKKHNY